MATEIIVYRNPGEKAMWDLLSTETGTYVLMGICGLISAALIFTVIQGLYQNYRNWRRFRL
jgi:hypothetical protein